MRTGFGWALVVFGLIMFADAIDNHRKHKDESLAMGITIGLLCCLGGAVLLRPQPKPGEKPKHGPREIEDMVLGAARKNNGRVTVTDVAADSNLTFSEAKEALDVLARAGACETLMTDEGMLVYNFGEIVGASTKAKAH